MRAKREGLIFHRTHRKVNLQQTAIFFVLTILDLLELFRVTGNGCNVMSRIFLLYSALFQILGNAKLITYCLKKIGVTIEPAKKIKI
jgi:hypothetical protein